MRGNHITYLMNSNGIEIYIIIFVPMGFVILVDNYNCWQIYIFVGLRIGYDA